MIERWDPDKHMPTLGEWLRAREQAEGAGWAGLYPSTGFVADGIAIGFLYRTDAPDVAWIDGVVTDPATTSAARGEALGKLIPRLYEEAATLGIHVVWATTSAPRLVELGKACGARILQRDHVCLAWTKE